MLHNGFSNARVEIVILQTQIHYMCHHRIFDNNIYLYKFRIYRITDFQLIPTPLVIAIIVLFYIVLWRIR